MNLVQGMDCIIGYSLQLGLVLRLLQYRLHFCSLHDISLDFQLAAHK